MCAGHQAGPAPALALVEFANQLQQPVGSGVDVSGQLSDFAFQIAE